ncbi:MAG: DEAD/DEAH box helicase [Bacteroidia bacterium]
MENNVLKILNRIDLHTLHTLVGVVILSAIKSVNKGEDEKELSKILILKYDNLILNEKGIREAIINSLSKDEVTLLASKCSLKKTTGSVYSNTIDFFSKGYNEQKSKIFADFLGLNENYYFKKIIDSRNEKELITAEFGEQVNILSYLHPFQKRVKDEVMYRLLQKDEKSFFVQMPTGAGKTLTALECVVDLLRKPNPLTEAKIPQKNKYIVWIVDTNELAEQAFQSFVKLWKLRGDRNLNAFRLFKNFTPDFSNEDGGIVFAGFDKFYSIFKKSNGAAFESLKYLVQNTEFLIVDEAHHSLAETYNVCISSFKNTPFIKIMGLSATPGTNDVETTTKLVELYSNDKISIRKEDWAPVNDAIQYLQEGEYLAKLTTKILETGISATESSEDSILVELASNSERNERIIEQIKLANENKQSTVVFACSLDHVYAILILCRANNIEANYIIGAVEQSERLSVLNSFKKREYFILINLEILSTGIDLPNIDKVIITRPINSPNLVSQILGRALRGKKNGGNENNTIINLKDNLLNFPSASYLYDYFEGAWEKIK